MKRLFIFFLFFGVLSCRQTPKVELSEQSKNEYISQNNSISENENKPTITENQLDSTKTENPINVDTVLSEKKEEIKKEENKKEEKKKEEKKKEEKNTEPAEPDFPDLPETDTYNPKEDPAPNEFVLIDREPKPKNLEAIIEDIKADAKLYGVKGKATVGVLVSTNGNCLKHYFFGVTNKKLEFIIADKILKLKFRPATLNGQPVKVWYKITIEIN